MPATRILFTILRHLSTFLALLAGLSVFALAFIIGLDVVARRIFGVSVQGSDEIGGYVLAIVASLGFSYVLFEKGFTRIDIFVKRLPKPVENAFNVIAYVSLAFVAIFFAQKAVAVFETTLQFDSRANSPLQTPIRYPQGFWVVGTVFFAICATLHALRAVVLWFTDVEALEAEFGFTDIEEEIHEISELTSDARERSK
ncbi:TRAP transporter small permease subunit [Rhodobacteraceae bacterium 2CG4]|uniref:TRAP transporter small permease protein n=1 Tax=Halovulum marinum TaxID=2662447 RepID=A0A6L5Z488_9RHOB|nr:TRAP transporter small permease [Halovulum marinum]MSU90842.1 TRAP transporter small permease subunit [Halovulum marinum]